ncbi:PilW family protein [Chromohalobacter canadensis]|uniref:PilW family protein n=1 Tax=Chromohalobacter canadensis TaxID=141389 RepID=UPI00240EC22B|nr:prepilin-type N-terminal cleavage/methylation domain-containing protein [Chromohalobacter canadensis]
MQLSQRMNNQHRQRGFTLIEMMISMFLGLIILGGTITAYQAISSVSEQRDNYYKLQDELMYIHRVLSSSIKVAKSVKIEESSNGNKLVLASSESVENRITCPGVGSDQDGQTTAGSVVYQSDGSDFLCQPKGRKIVDLSSAGKVGIEAIRFCRLLEEGEKGCKTGEGLDGVVVFIDYYDWDCDPSNEACESKALSFHLAARDINDSDKPKEDK